MQATVVKVDLDVDSLNKKGFEADRSDESDEVEDVVGSKTHPGKLIQNCEWLAPESELHSYQAVLELPSWLNPSVARISIAYDDTVTSLWNVDRPAVRSYESLQLGGNHILPGTYTVPQLGLSDGILYVDGFENTQVWGGSGISVAIDPDGDGPAGFVASDLVTLTVVDYRFKAYVVQPYEYHHWTGKRVLATLDDSTPENLRDCVLDGCAAYWDVSGPSSGWHGCSVPLWTRLLRVDVY